MITVTESASEKIRQLLENEGTSHTFLRVGVKAGGCSGFSYGMGFDEEKKEDDTMLTINGLTIVVDQESARYLSGVVIDFKESGMSGGFTIDNPNAVASCGCGSSFKMKDEEGIVEKCDDKVEV
jgi:iron-sulfur cluster assembly protein